MCMPCDLRCKNYSKCYLFGDDEIENFNGQASFSQAHNIGNILSLLPTFFSYIFVASFFICTLQN